MTQKSILPRKKVMQIWIDSLSIFWMMNRSARGVKRFGWLIVHYLQSYHVLKLFWWHSLTFSNVCRHRPNISDTVKYFFTRIWNNTVRQEEILNFFTQYIWFNTNFKIFLESFYMIFCSVGYHPNGNSTSWLVFFKGNILSI